VNWINDRLMVAHEVEKARRVRQDQRKREPFRGGGLPKSRERGKGTNPEGLTKCS
jgi:hypothetical protein